ncbi:MAG: hypothetical protein FJY85_05020 [Deltaproteobacteria bacterium]|nr:hypothetical protein [Deltaproteobacteria bacterium]
MMILFRNSVSASLLFVFLPLLTALSKVTLLSVLIQVALGVTAMVVVEFFYRVRIWILRREGKKR